jgi:hypothetical protein
VSRASRETVSTIAAEALRCAADNRALAVAARQAATYRKVPERVAADAGLTPAEAEAVWAAIGHAARIGTPALKRGRRKLQAIFEGRPREKPRNPFNNPHGDDVREHDAWERGYQAACRTSQVATGARRRS